MIWCKKRIRSKGWYLVIAWLFLCLAIGSWAASTQTTSWGITGNRSATDRQKSRFAPHESAMRRLVIAIDANTDSSTTTDSNLVGTLYRISYYADGNAPSYDVNITDTDGKVLFADVAGKSSTDPCAFMITMANSAGTQFAGVPFSGALTVKWANLDDGPGCTTKHLHVILYYREEWQ